MSAIKILKHLFIPHESNNLKAKLLHSQSLFLITFVIVGFQLLLNIIPKNLPSVLGYAANISPQEVINLTNKERIANGLSALTENSTLDSAALAKGQDMLTKGYWAHFAPDGTSPWSFFTGFGYKYQYAGENLARDFTNAGSAVTAWMNSPSHKENILNPHYKEIGIGVVEGSLAGADTTIVVQFFGAALSGAPSIPIAKAKEPSSTALPAINPTTTPLPTLQPLMISTKTSTPEPVNYAANTKAKVFISPFQFTKNLSLAVTGILLLVLAIDLLVVRRKRISRVGGRTLAHISYLCMILAVIFILKAGQII